MWWLLLKLKYIHDMRTKEEIEAVGDEHFFNNVETPLPHDAFVKSDEKKIENIF